MMTAGKLIACLAMLLPTGCKASAELTSPKDANKLPTSPPTEHETQALRTADTAFTVADEERTSPVRFVARANPAPHELGVEHSPSAIEYLVRSKYVDWLFQGTHPIDAHAQLDEELLKEGLLEEGQGVDWYNEYTELFGKLYDEHGNGLFKNMEKVKKRLHELESHKDIEPLIELYTQSMKYWKEGKDLKAVYKRLGKPQKGTMKHKVYLDYQRAFNDRQYYVRLKYFSWYDDKTSPAEAQKQLENEFPGEEKMMTRYYQEYQKFYEVNPLYVKELEKLIMERALLYSVDSYLSNLNKKNNVSLDTINLLHDVCKLWMREHDLKQWMDDKETPQYVFSLLKLGNINSSTSDEYQIYLRYYKWWCYTFPKEAVEKWKNDHMAPRDVFYLLKFDLKPNYTEDKMCPFFLEYTDWFLTYGGKVIGEQSGVKRQKVGHFAGN